MGRRSSVSIKGKVPYSRSPDALKSRHRFSDTKYRHNVQFFYGLLQEVTNKSLTKDILLNAILRDIEMMQNDIVLVAGSQKLGKFDGKFLEIVEMGENIWRKDKNPTEWWNQMQELLKNIMNDDIANFHLDIPASSKTFSKQC